MRFDFNYEFLEFFKFAISPGYDTQVSQTPQGMIPRRVNLPGYDTPASQSHQSIIPLQVNKNSDKTWLPRVWYPGKSISLGYVSYVTRVSFFNLKFE